jgi:hypothetical protein
MQPAHLRPVDSDLPDYPDELCDPRLTADFFTAFWHDRWLSSRLHLKASMTVQGMALNLFFLSRKQNPVGSLPSDQDMIARLLRVDLAEWRGAMAQDITPLHNWSRYQYGDEVVLGHPVVIEVARDALDRREARKLSNEAKAVQQRQARLVDVLRGEPFRCQPALLDDAVLVRRLDEWLQEHHRGQRRMPQFAHSVQRALGHATKQGWIGGTKAPR